MGRVSSNVVSTKPATSNGATVSDDKIAKAPAPVTLANADSATQGKAIIDAINATGRTVVAAALVVCDGSVDKVLASGYLGAPLIPSLHLIARVIPILRNSAPSSLFTDGNNRGARVGELFASKLGLSSLFRDVNRATLKDARASLVESAK